MGFNTVVSTYLYYGVMWIMLLFSIFYIVRSIDVSTIFFLMFFTIILLGTLLFYPSAKFFLVEKPSIDWFKFPIEPFIAVLPFFLIGNAVSDYSLLREYWHKTARIGMIVAAGSDLLTIIFNLNKNYDNMSYAYSLAALLCIIVYEYLSKKNKIDLILLIVGFILQLIAGTRGPLVCIFAVFIIYFLFSKTDLKTKSIFILIIVLLLVFLSSGLFGYLVESVNTGIQHVGVSSRILDMVISGDIVDSSGRDIIGENIWNAIIKKPFTGYGLAGDRGLTQLEYSHNLFLEIWCHFGLIFGTILLIILTIMITRGIRSKNEDLKALVIIMFSFAIVKLFFSSSYMNSQEFFILIGLCINIKRSENYAVKEDSKKAVASI